MTCHESIRGCDMKNAPKIPIVAAMEVLTGREYGELLDEYNDMSPEMKVNVEATYNENNMGYGPEAREAYCDAKRALGESW